MLSSLRCFLGHALFVMLSGVCFLCYNQCMKLITDVFSDELSDFVSVKMPFHIWYIHMVYHQYVLSDDLPDDASEKIPFRSGYI